MIDKIKARWAEIALIAIVLFSFYIRSIGIVPGHMVSYDPIYQLRYTQYLVNWGHLPVWDELTYYVGRMVMVSDGFLMFLMTGYIYGLLKIFSFDLITSATYSAALYGSLLAVPAYFLGKELSNKYGGLIAALLISVAPQILVRTFGSSYDTDQLVLFFILSTLYLGYSALNQKSISSILYASLGFSAFMLTWSMFSYSFYILMGFVGLLFLLTLFLGNKSELNRKSPFNDRLKFAINEAKNNSVVLLSMLGILFFVSLLLNIDILKEFLQIIGFAHQAESYIVNISIAELQALDLLSLGGLLTIFGRFALNNMIIDVAVLLLFLSGLFFGLYTMYKKDMKHFSFAMTILILGLYTTTKGIRFTEFSSALFLVLIGAGIGYLIDFFSKKGEIADWISKTVVVLLIVFALFIGLNLGPSLGPDMDENWQNAWTFLKENTPENSVVGTWWDPGHMIAGIAERRNIADGAHCGTELCMYNINDRIVDLGKTMATTNEDDSINLINKYKGTSDKQYWIASGDLIPKFQWVQYFGTGCDARSDQNCRLYTQIPASNVIKDQNEQVVGIAYSSITVMFEEVPYAVYVENRRAMPITEVWYYKDDKVVKLEYDDENVDEIYNFFEPMQEALKFELSNTTVDQILWIPKSGQYVVIIPENLKDAVFTKMFMLEGEGLGHFKQVFRNEEVKIYEVV